MTYEIYGNGVCKAEGKKQMAMICELWWQQHSRSTSIWR